MPPFHRIEDLPSLVGQTVSTRGWVMTTRSSGKIGFVTLRDGTGYLQVVLSKKDMPETAWEAVGQLTQETSVEVTGTVRVDARAPGGVELTAADLKILGPSHDFPITPKEHGTAFLFEHRHLWLRSRLQVAIARVRHEVVQALRDFFYERHFVLVDTPSRGATSSRSRPCGPRSRGSPTPTAWARSRRWAAKSRGDRIWEAKRRHCWRSNTTGR